MRGSGGLSVRAWFETIALQEPSKHELRQGTAGRRAFVCCYDPASAPRDRDFEQGGPLLVAVADACDPRHFWAEIRPGTITVVTIESGVLCDAPERDLVIFSLGTSVNEADLPNIDIKIDDIF